MPDLFRWNDIHPSEFYYRKALNNVERDKENKE